MKKTQNKSIKNFQITLGSNGLLGLRWKQIGSSKSLKSELKKVQKQSVDDEVWEAATDFQRQVWKACMLIPEGCVATYSDIACAIGKPQAVRAVARALGSNQVAVKIPCHRVIAQGGLGGYTCEFGLDAKLALLRAESF